MFDLRNNVVNFEVFFRSGQFPIILLSQHTALLMERTMKRLTLLAASMLIATNTLAAEQSNLTFDVYNADQNSFYVNSTLIIGETEVMVIDTGFTKADALRIAAKVLDTGKTLKTIFISQADPDYYLSLIHI